MDVVNWLQVEDGLYSAGQPGDAAWGDIAGLGVKTVVNLRPATEQPESEQPAVEAAGMQYINIPVGSPNDLTADAAKRLIEIIDGANDGVLVHCKSGNRVGALLALTAKERGKSADDALAYGRQGGLTGLEPFVVQLLQK